MAYRTKYHNLIWNNYLNKVFDFIGLTTEVKVSFLRICPMKSELLLMLSWEWMRLF